MNDTMPHHDAVASRKSQPACVRVRLGRPELRGSGVGELTLIAGVNETIKHAITASRGISLIAINAGLVAGRAGSRARGFGVVAKELRDFSERMSAGMSGWSDLICNVVRETARDRTQAHQLYKLQDTARRSPKAQAAIAAACARSQARLEEITRRNSVQVFELLRLVQRTEKQRMAGQLIARSAVIEAAHGGAMRGAMQQMSSEIGAAIARFSERSEAVGQSMRKAVA